MTDAERDAAWRSLPEAVKKKVKRLYKHYCPYGRTPHETVRDIIEIIFGKHNFTAIEGKPSFSVGDVVITTQNTSMYSMGWIGEIEQIDANFAYVRLFVKDEITVKVDTNHLAPYTKEQEPKKGERVDFSSSSLQNRKNITENDISSVPKETAEDLSNLMAEVNNFIERNQDSQVDWLAYRMELAKEVVKVVYHHKTPHKDIIDDTMQIVNGIVERLKGGENGKV